MKYSKKEIEDAKAVLRKYDWENDKLIAVINKVSPSGMTRHIDFYSHKDLHWLSKPIAVVLNYSWKEDGVVVGGCGMDMVLHVVDTLTSELYTREERKAKKLKGNGGYCIEWKTL